MKGGGGVGGVGGGEEILYHNPDLCFVTRLRVGHFNTDAVRLQQNNFIPR